MKEVLMMLLPDCPHCHRADQMVEQLQRENEAYRKVIIRRVNEAAEPDFANSLDYYYVPTFYVDGVKLLEGVPTLDGVRAVLDAAIQ